MDPRTVSKDMLVGLVEIQEPMEGLEFSRARQVSDNIAGEALTTPFLLAWFDKKSGTHSPPIC